MDLILSSRIVNAFLKRLLAKYLKNRIGENDILEVVELKINDITGRVEIDCHLKGDISEEVFLDFIKFF